MSNIVVLDGRLTQAPSELRQFKTNGGEEGCARTIRLAHNGRDGKALFVNAEVFGGWAKNLDGATKGTPVVVTGTLALDEWTGKDGERKSAIYIKAREVKRLEQAPHIEESAAEETV